MKQKDKAEEWQSLRSREGYTGMPDIPFSWFFFLFIMTSYRQKKEPPAKLLYVSFLRHSLFMIKCLLLLQTRQQVDGISCSFLWGACAVTNGLY